MYCKILILFFVLRNIFSKPQCDSHSADFPSLFQSHNERIVNGFDTMEPLPYQLMVYNQRFACGATLISLKYATSALHCFWSYNRRKYLDEIIVTAGVYKRSKKSTMEQVRKKSCQAQYRYCILR